jgi:hypothetical protein
LLELDELSKGNLTKQKTPYSYRLDGTVIVMENFSWSAIKTGNVIKIHVDCIGKDDFLDEFFFAFDNDGKDFPIHGHFDSKGRIYIKPQNSQITVLAAQDSWSFDINIPVTELPGQVLKNIRMNLSRQIKNYDQLWSWPGGYLPEKPLNHLGLSFYNPKYMGKLQEN